MQQINASFHTSNVISLCEMAAIVFAENGPFFKIFIPNEHTSDQLIIVQKRSFKANRRAKPS